MKNTIKSFLKAGALWKKNKSDGNSYYQGFIQFDTEGNFGMSEKERKALCEELLSGERVFANVFKITRNNKTWYNITVLNPFAPKMEKKVNTEDNSDEL